MECRAWLLFRLYRFWCHPTSRFQGFPRPLRKHVGAFAVLWRVVHLGVNHIDTAQFYESQISNELIREALYSDPQDLGISVSICCMRLKRAEIVCVRDID